MIVASVERHYLELGVKQFYVGGYGMFDSLAASAVKEVKRYHAEICLYLLLPYHPAERHIDIPFGFDGTFHPPLINVPRKYAIVKSNRYMIETCDTIICHVSHIGNTRKLLEFARRREEKGLVYVENIGEVY